MCTVIVVVPPSIVLIPFLMAARAFFFGGGDTCVKLTFAQVGASSRGQRDAGKGPRAEKYNVDGLGRRGGGSQKGLLNR